MEKLMTKFVEIQIKVCQDAINHMEQAKKQKNEVAFNFEKGKLIEVLKIIKPADPHTYSKYSKLSEMQFHIDT